MQTLKHTPASRTLPLLLSLMISACGGGDGASSPTISFTPVTPTVETPSANLPPVDVSSVTMNDPGSTLDAHWYKGAIMEIYVRGYKDSNGDGIGDLRGVIQSLDYLKDLGIKGIWLMPITQSEDRDHGYAVKDYRNIEADYGTLADYDELIKQAHARGIGVILDYVMNHSASTHPLFINSADTTTNTYRNWYLWKDIAPTGWSIFGSNPWYNTKNGAYFAAFYSGMPDFNLLNSAVVDFHQNNLRFWLNRAADGFRFDAVGNLIENGPAAWESQPESIALMGKVQQNIGVYSQRFMVCEAPGNPAAFAAPNSCGSTFAFNHNHDIINASKGQDAAITAVADYFKSASLNMSVMLSNHDSFAGQRLWDEVAGNLPQYRLAAATYLLQPGTPFIYYGEEIGMAGAAQLDGDHKLRTPMSWTNDSNTAGFTSGKAFRDLSANSTSQNVATQINDSNSLYNFYKTLLALRNGRISIREGDYSQSNVNGKVLSFMRQTGSEKSLVIINYGSIAANPSINIGKSNASLNSVYPNTGTQVPSDANGLATLNIAPQSVIVFDVK